MFEELESKVQLQTPLIEYDAAMQDYIPTVAAKQMKLSNPIGQVYAGTTAAQGHFTSIKHTNWLLQQPWLVDLAEPGHDPHKTSVARTLVCQCKVKFDHVNALQWGCKPKAVAAQRSLSLKQALRLLPPILWQRLQDWGCHAFPQQDRCAESR